MTAIARGGLDPKGLITALEGGVPREGGYEEAALEEGVDYRVAGSLSVTDRIMNDTFWIGVYPGMTEAKLNYMVACIQEFCKR